MKIHIASKKQAKIRLALEGPSGSGKTYSSLLIAQGLSEIEKTCIICTENGAADLYSHLGKYSVLPLSKPYTPERYIEALTIAEESGAECIIIDSLSHCWEYIIEYHSTLTGNSFTNWSKLTPRHNSLISKILTSKAHIISTLRVKQDYILQDKGNGKLVPEKVGLKAIQKDGIDYEFTCVFTLDVNHFAVCNKDRTLLFTNNDKFIIKSEIGSVIKSWCESGITMSKVKELINESKTLQELTKIYTEHLEFYPQLKLEFDTQKLLLTTSNNQKN